MNIIRTLLQCQPSNRLRFIIDKWYNKEGSIERLGGFLPGGCNGIVAADEIVLSKAQLEQLASRGPQTKSYPGTDSAVGCGSNSRYQVTWTILRAP
jgi:hypothetical protein